MGFALEEIIFSGLGNRPDLFFEILPEDWSGEIRPVWQKYAKTSTIYVVRQKGKIIGGGILFSSPSPDVSYYDAAKISRLTVWFEKGYEYIAYFFILPKYRGIGLGVKWLSEVIEINPSRGLFLTIEDQSLIRFYEKAGFHLHDEIIFNDHKEWLLIRGGS